MMMSNPTATSVHASVVVNASIDHAFSVFTDGIMAWWGDDHHILEAKVTEMVFEPRVGGNIVDRGEDGSESRWARVLAYEPPNRLVFSWDISTRWQLETDHTKTSEVEVRFIAEGPGQTRVDLEHRNLDRHGDGWEQMRDAVGSPDGWPGGMNDFAAAAERVAAR
jgi:uncharacterized protein YndB with AHSA1/START domain